MRRFVLALALLLVGCQSNAGVPLTGAGDVPINYFHDTAHRVSCWTYGGGGNYGKAISCLPDAQVALP